MDTFKEGIRKSAAGVAPKTFAAIAEGTCVRNFRRLASGPAKHDKLRRVAHRQRTEDHRVDQAEDRRIGADAEGQRQDRYGCEPGVAAELAEAVAQILDQGFEPLEAPGGAHLFLDLRGVAEGAACGVGGFFRRSARGLLVFRFQFQMTAQFALKLRLALMTAEQAGQTNQARCYSAHESTSGSVMVLASVRGAVCAARLVAYTSRQSLTTNH